MRRRFPKASNLTESIIGPAIEVHRDNFWLGLCFLCALL
jgi:hypothetical protein